MTDQLKLNADTFLPLRDVVFQTLRAAILKGELEPGERLMEIHLANKLGVSRTPVREAIRMLEQEGLAVTIPRRGAHVAKMTEKDLQDVLEIRDVLDALAATNACQHMTDELYAELEAAMDDFEKAIAGKDVRSIVEADEKFHNVIYKAADNPKLDQMVQNLKEQMYRFRYEYVKDKADYDNLIREHSKIMEGLQKRDVDYVRDAMHTHLKNQVDAVKAVIRMQAEAGRSKEEVGPKSWRAKKE